MEKFFYRVEEGDTILSLSEKFRMSACKIIKQNNLKKEISCGDILCIESGGQRLYKVNPFDTASSVAKKFNTTEEKILTDNGVEYIYYGLIICV